MNPKDELGREGEQVAVEYVERAGLRVLDRNWRCAEREIDIVAAERQVMVVCEVKTRSGTGFGTPLEAITRQKLARLRRLAARWLVANGVLFDEIRIDVIGLIRNEAGLYEIEHIRLRTAFDLHSCPLTAILGRSRAVRCGRESFLSPGVPVGIDDHGADLAMTGDHRRLASQPGAVHQIAQRAPGFLNADRLHAHSL